jgi:hypothetical protein
MSSRDNLQSPRSCCQTCSVAHGAARTARCGRDQRNVSRAPRQVSCNRLALDCQDFELVKTSYYLFFLFPFRPLTRLFFLYEDIVAG